MGRVTLWKKHTNLYSLCQFHSLLSVITKILKYDNNYPRVWAESAVGISHPAPRRDVGDAPSPLDIQKTETITT